MSNGWDPESPYERRVPGVVVGLVEQTTGDPDNLGRIKVSYPWFGDTLLSNWCRVASFFAGPNVGAWFLPARGTEVLVAFEAGNLNAPYVIGSLWNGKDSPPVPGEQQQQDVRVIQTRGGSTIRIDDTEGSETIEIKDKGGDSLLFDVAQKRVALSTSGTLELSAGETGTLKLSAATIELSASSQVKISVTEGTASLQASGDVSLQGATIRLN